MFKKTNKKGSVDESSKERFLSTVTRSQTKLVVDNSKAASSRKSGKKKERKTSKKEDVNEPHPENVTLENNNNKHEFVPNKAKEKYQNNERQKQNTFSHAVTNELSIPYISSKKTSLVYAPHAFAVKMFMQDNMPWSYTFVASYVELLRHKFEKDGSIHFEILNYENGMLAVEENKQE